MELRRRRSRRPCDESGQAFVFVVLFLAVFLGLAALVLDIGHAYYADRSLQASTDAAALAGAQELPNSGKAVGVAHTYAGTSGSKNARENVPGVSTEASTECRPKWPCDPVNAVVVEEAAEVETFFAKVFGIDTIPVHARAVAVTTEGEVPYAIYSNDSDCGGFSFKANPNEWHVDGAVRSNGDFEANGENITAGWASTHGDPCKTDANGKNISFGGSPEPEIEPDLKPWPKWFEKTDFACDYTKNKFEFNASNVTIPPGVYCATESFIANGNDQFGNITVLAPEIKINGNRQTFRPYAKDVLFFATGSKEMSLNGNNYDWEGIIFHPGGRIKINGDASSVLEGLIEGVEVEVNGNGFEMIGNGPSSSEPFITLVE
jgi:Flp pilus assembly protein TadG